MSTRLEDTQGVVHDVPDAQVDAVLARGWKAPANAAELETTAPKDTSTLGAVSAGLSSAASTASLGLSDVALRALGSKADVEQDSKLRSDHRVASTIGAIAGAVVPTGLTAGVGRLGANVAERVGGGILGSAAGGVAEGTLYGAGQGVSELALSDQPLTAERIAGSLSSNMLLGGVTGGIASSAGKLLEVGIARAGARLEEAAATRNAIHGVPEDLAHLDEAGLKEAGAVAKTEHAADTVAERKSLEELRVNQKAELANQVRDLHAELATEKPIFHAVSGDDVAAIDGMKDIKVQLAKSYSGLRSQLDNEIAAARDPRSLLKPLEMRQTALEALQAKLPEVQAVVGQDARALSLAHVGDALEQTKAQIAAIEQTAKAPLTSGRLTMLESGPSARMQAIADAREALKKAPELGIVGKGASSAAFMGVTALAHSIPGVGLAAPFLGKGAADFVETLFRRGTGVAAKAAEKGQAAVSAFLDAGARLKPVAIPTATHVLSSVRYGAEVQPKSEALHHVFAARAEELRGQTMYAPDGSVQMRPEARQAMAAKLDPIRHVDPVLADQIETSVARKTAYVSAKLPRQPEVAGLQIGPDTWRPSDLQMRSFARTVHASENPEAVEESLARGTVTPEAAEAYRVCYPERFAALRDEVFQKAPQLSKTLPMSKRIALSVFCGVPLMPELQPNVLAVLQGTFAEESGSNGGSQSPAPQPNFGKLGSMRSSEKPTPAQTRSQS